MSKQENQLALLDKARAALAQVQDVGQALEIHDQAEAIRHYCAVRDRSDKAAIKAAEIKLRAARRVGELLPDKGKRGGDRKSNAAKSSPRAGLDFPKQRAAEFRKLAPPSKGGGLTDAAFESYIADKLAGGEQPSQAQLLRQIKEAQRQARRDANLAKVKATAQDADRPQVSAARYATIVADPPWSPESANAQDAYGRSRGTYATLGEAEIAALTVDGVPVAQLADEDAHLYLWAINRTLEPAFRILEAWGFRFVTILTWCKPSIGMGNYFRNNTEHVLFGVKGQQPLKVKNRGTWFEAKRGPAGHSSKPPEFYDLVDACSPGPVLELFSRVERPGWTTWGEG